MEQAKKQTIAGTVTNAITQATAQRLGNGTVVPIQRPKVKGGKK